MVPLRIEVANVNAVKENLSLRRIVESLQHLNDSGFSTAAGAAKSDNAVLLVVDFDVDALKYLHFLLRGVAELHVAQRDASLHRASGALTARRRHEGLGGDDVHDLVGGTEHRKQIAKAPCDNDTVPEEHQHVEQEGGKCSDRGLTVDVEVNSEFGNDDHAAVEENLLEKGEASLQNGFLGSHLLDTFVSFQKLGYFFIFVRKSLDCAHI